MPYSDDASRIFRRAKCPRCKKHMYIGFAPIMDNYNGAFVQIRPSLKLHEGDFPPRISDSEEFCNDCEDELNEGI